MEIDEATEREYLGSSSVTQTTAHDGGLTKKQEGKPIFDDFFSNESLIRKTDYP